jgi:hypothetical protein
MHDDRFWIMIDRLLCITSCQLACLFRWFIVAESIACWFVMREKHCWMTADSAE